MLSQLLSILSENHLFQCLFPLTIGRNVFIIKLIVVYATNANENVADVIVAYT